MPWHSTIKHLPLRFYLKVRKKILMSILIGKRMRRVKRLAKINKVLLNRSEHTIILSKMDNKTRFRSLKRSGQFNEYVLEIKSAIRAKKGIR